MGKKRRSQKTLQYQLQRRRRRRMGPMSKRNPELKLTRRRRPSQHPNLPTTWGKKRKRKRRKNQHLHPGNLKKKWLRRPVARKRENGKSEYSSSDVIFNLVQF